MLSFSMFQNIDTKHDGYRLYSKWLHQTLILKNTANTLISHYYLSRNIYKILDNISEIEALCTG